MSPRPIRLFIMENNLNCEFGDRMKAHEAVFTSAKVRSDQWLCVRVDGKKFSKFTKKFEKPYDNRMTKLMVDTAKFLMKETHATISYTQSDEITLIYSPKHEHIFGGKISKINSILASMATAFFNQQYSAREEFIDLYTPKLAFFDCRAWAIDTMVEASNVLYWRVQDACKNSISATFRWTLGHSKMQHLSGPQMISIMKDEGYHWSKMPEQFRYGTMFEIVTEVRELTEEELKRIPETKRPVDNLVERNKIQNILVERWFSSDIETRLQIFKRNLLNECR